MDRVLSKGLLALMLGLLTAGWAQCQDPAVRNSAPGAVTVDAAQLDGVATVDVPLRFHVGGNAAFARPELDDTSWFLIQPGEGRTLNSARPPRPALGETWVRLHLHLVNATAPLAVSIRLHNGLPFGAFANGRQIGQSEGFANRRSYLNDALVLPLPNSPDIVLAICVRYPRTARVHFFPLEQVTIGKVPALANAVELDRYRQFETRWLAHTTFGLVFLAFVPFSLILLQAQRRPEYFWLAVFCCILGIDYLLDVALYAGSLPSQPWTIVVTDSLYSAVEITSLEYVCSMAELRDRRAMRVVQGVMIGGFLLWGTYHGGLISFEGRDPRPWIIDYSLVETLLWLLFSGYVLVSAFRRGIKECGLLLLPMTVLASSSVFLYVHTVLTASVLPGLYGVFHGVGFSTDDGASLLVIVGLATVALYRFIRVSQHEQLAAGELEAARTVQQLLLPAVTPATPGFVVESVYRPAREVGGDFFLVLPLEDWAGNKSLLTVVGDVSGKGMQAAMVVSTIVGALRVLPTHDPVEVLEHLNRMLFGHISGFATCCTALLQADGLLHIANAGNPAPYYDGEEVATAPGLPLGLVSEVSYERATYALSPGKRLTFVSDGIIEATRAKTAELFGFDRTRAMSMEPASAIAEAACVFGVGAPQADDMTVVTVACTW